MSAATRRRLTGGLLAVTVTVVLSACGVPADNRVHVIDPSHVPQPLVAPPTPNSR